MKYSLLITLFLLYNANGFSQTPDWSSKIASIIYANCSDCHHEGAIAPFPLMSYEDAFSRATDIQSAVNARLMPPWPADPSYNHFANEKVLCDEDISAINDWVNDGMPSGDLSQEPPPPVFGNESNMTDPDEIIQFPSYTVPQDLDDYRGFVIHSNFNEDKYIKQIEFVASDPSMVHHLFLMQDTSDVSFQKDMETSETGFPASGTGFSPYSELICGWIPGANAVSLPANFVFKVPAGADLVLVVHFAPGSIGKTDSIKAYVKYDTDDDVRPVHNERLLYWFPPSLINPPFFIPANQVTTFYEQTHVFKHDLSLIAIQPHMHLIGKSFKVFMVTAPGDTTNLLYIPQWQFEWQMIYFFTHVIKIPEGARIFGEAVYDNTLNNPVNPNNPPQDVHAGESTFQEMMGCRFSLLDYLPGDENILLDSTFIESNENIMAGNTSLDLHLFPNPATDEFGFSVFLPEHEVSWTLTNSAGQIINSRHPLNIAKGAYAEKIDVSDLPRGIYFLRLKSGLEEVEAKVVVE